MRAYRHLQHGRVLASSQFRHQDDLTVRQFKSVMVRIRLVLINLPKPGHPMREPLETETVGSLASQIFFKGQLRAR
jgi:hypothetical protein